MKKYEDQTLSFEERAAALVAEMTLEEKTTQVGNNSLPIPRLGLPGYDFWGEASHGFFGPVELKEMDVTSYPVCLAMSQSWDREKIKRVTKLISDECRAHHNLHDVELHMWCPTVNMAREPRNGRSDENFGEDPFLAGKMAASYIQGMQEGDEKYVKVVATPKHYALNSSENNRHTGCSFVDEATLREYYAKVFEYAIKEGKAESIMTSYPRVNGVPSSLNPYLLTTLLREEWGFDGVVVSDCCAVADCYKNPNFAGMTDLAHSYCKSMEEASAMSLIAGTDVTTGTEHKKFLKKAVELGYIEEDVIDRAAIRAFTSRFRLGLFDDKDKVPFNKIGAESIASEEMAAMSVDMANDTIVLLKNEKKLLPIDKKAVKSILVIGPNALYRQLGGYSAGQCPLVDTVVNIMALDGIRNEVKDDNIEVRYEKGWGTDGEFDKAGLIEFLPGFDPSEIMMDVNPGAASSDSSEPFDIFKVMGEKRHVPEDPDYRADNDILFERALTAAKEADLVIMVAGTDDNTASEEHDRDSLALPYGQDEKIQKVLEVNENTVVVLTTLGAVNGQFFEKAHTVVNAHFAGQAQGTAIANVLFGKVNPNAKLTATWYKNESDLPMINDYGIKPQDTYDNKARTYMYFKGDVLFPFGYGLSYTDYEYSNMRLDKKSYDANETIQVKVDVENIGERAGAEIVQVYLSKILQEKQWDNKPIRQLKGFTKVWLEAGEKKTVTIEIPLSEVTFWSNRQKKMVVESGTYCVEVGASSAELPCREEITVSGEWNAKLYNVYAIADKYIMKEGQTSHIMVSAAKEDAEHLDMCRYRPEFTSSNEKVACVDENGVVSAKSSGTALIHISVTCGDTVKATKIPVVVSMSE